MSIGLHIRLQKSLKLVLERAIELDVPTFQTFFTTPQCGLYKITNEDAEAFATYREKFKRIYLHASYYTNLAAPQSRGSLLLERELDAALKLGITHCVLHPGARSGSQTHNQALGNCARQLSKVLKKFPEMTVLLENCAHSSRAIGGDLQDLAFMLSMSDRPEQIRFCIDTAHAYAWGYEIDTNLFNTLVTLLPKDTIDLIHLNDSHEKRGSKLDRHAPPGNGLIGLKPLQQICAALPNSYKIIELAKCDDHLAPELLKRLQSH